MSTHDLRNQLQERLKVLDVEREGILRMLKLYREQERSNGASRMPQTVRKRRARSNGHQTEGPFAGITGGPTDSIMRVLASATEGLTYAQLVDAAARIVKTKARDPRATVAASIHSLTKRGRIELRLDKYFLA